MEIWPPGKVYDTDHAVNCQSSLHVSGIAVFLLLQIFANLQAFSSRLEQLQQFDGEQSGSSEPLSNCYSSTIKVDESDNATFYVKVYMEGIPIGRKLDLLAHDGYSALVGTLNYMFNTAILCKFMDLLPRLYSIQF